MMKPRKDRQILGESMNSKREDANKRSKSNTEDTEMRVIMTKVRR